MKFINKEPHKTINPKRIYEVKQTDFCNFGVSNSNFSEIENSPKKKSPEMFKPGSQTKFNEQVVISQLDLDLANETCELFDEICSNVEREEDLKSCLKIRNVRHFK